ncbi:MAG: ATP-binding cassette domain-containing protein, partial [Desulfobacterales bacterium]|nr:ATP-binding cassette domain-containing protein [Desulfobacterales bacterium]
MLKIENLRAYYDTIPALKGVSVEVPEGEIVSIIGANGAGKSTLLKAISGLIKTQQGRIAYKDQDIAGRAANKIVALGISQVPEGRQIFAHLTVQDNINLGAYLYFKRRNRAEIAERMNEVYTLFPILKRRVKQIAGTLSGGEQQMLAI